jgi:hypothetical protein
LARKNKTEEPSSPAHDIPVLIKIGPYFLDKKDVRGIARFGKGSKLTLSNGDELVVNISYDKVSDILR